MHENQIENLLSLSPEARYEYFVRYCSDFELVWGLAVGEDKWVVIKGEDEKETFLVWPHRDLATACCFAEHQSMGAQPQSISLKSFIDNCVPDMGSQGVVFGIFFDQSRQGLAVDGEKLRADLENEVSTVWD